MQLWERNPGLFVIELQQKSITLQVKVLSREPVYADDGLGYFDVIKISIGLVIVQNPAISGIITTQVKSQRDMNQTVHNELTYN